MRNVSCACQSLPQPIYLCKIVIKNPSYKRIVMKLTWFKYIRVSFASALCKCVPLRYVMWCLCMKSLQATDFQMALTHAFARCIVQFKEPETNSCTNYKTSKCSVHMRPHGVLYFWSQGTYLYYPLVTITTVNALNTELLNLASTCVLRLPHVALGFPNARRPISLRPSISEKSGPQLVAIENCGCWTGSRGDTMGFNGTKKKAKKT